MHVKEEVLSITYKAICNMTHEKLGVMKKEEEEKKTEARRAYITKVQNSIFMCVS